MKNSLKIAMCGIVTALSVVLLFFGGIVYLLIYIMPMITSLLMIMMRRTFGVSSALIVYIATSLLSFILIPEKECMLMYVFFFGYYPILFPETEKIKSVIIKWLSKLILFNSSLCIIQLILVYIFNVPFLEENEGRIFILVFAVLMNLLFVIYDYCVKAIYSLYINKLEKRIKKYFK